MPSNPALTAAAGSARRFRQSKKRRGRPPAPPPPPSHSLRPRRRHVSSDEEEENELPLKKKLRPLLKLPHSKLQNSVVQQRAEESDGSSLDSSDDVSGSESDLQRSDEEATGKEIKRPLKKKGGSGHREEEKPVAPRRLTRLASGALPTVPKTPLPDRKTLVAVLDKLQKKDTYGAFSQPVDPEELPDYHAIIEFPMDFATIRKKLLKGDYTTFEQFEDDVFLICSNAMQYNARDTIYFKQARSIQDMARKIFQSLRADIENGEAAGKSEENIRFPIVKKPMKRSSCITSLDPPVSNMPSGAVTTSFGDACTELNKAHVDTVDGPVDVMQPIEGSLSPVDSKVQKPEEISANCTPSGNCSPSKLEQEPFIIDENRRATYNITEEERFDEHELVTDVFKDEMKQLVSVSLDEEYSYARSLARFAGPLGPIAWRIASEKIAKALPAGIKFGPGWVDKFEPLLTPLLSFEKHIQPQNRELSTSQTNFSLQTDEETERVCKTSESMLTGTSSMNLVTAKDIKITETKQKLVKCSGSKGTSSNIMPGQQNDRHIVNSAKQIGLCNSSSRSGVEEISRRREYSYDVPNRSSVDMHPQERSCNLLETRRHPEEIKSRTKNSEEHRLSHLNLQRFGNDASRVAGEFSDQKNIGNSNREKQNRPLNFTSGNQPQVGNYLRPVSSHSNINENPFRFLSSSGEMSNHSSGYMTSDSSIPVVISIPEPSSATRAWMSIGATPEVRSSHNTNLIDKQPVPSTFWRTSIPAARANENSGTRAPSGVFGMPMQVTSEESRIQNRGLVVFPQLVGADIQRLHGQSPIHGRVHRHTHNKENKDMHAPDLNVTFQPSGSPVQQPDLALQL